ncbi:AAT family amino acid transporter/D-serine/D-alanine/glycine transporter [Melghirimyces profundicolus]|uniref:AAT family amino acid transporter/D-serine/D-alanine/glycine transporter n=1 Tax=Melghirimyces profundicolus TaxID=1242148 RepID=A0A2T6C7Y1_9BACL|nr:amino acid permease [Melghirimyces profundicolus]PTX64430.1 AAT family amino acid transporter/D-serine/D-alanine/glycine transporter [Melghirimyces profundicolus]
MRHQQKKQQELKRGLSERHIQLIAIGGAIGVGLFLGSAKAIKTAGPALILAYALAGLVIFLVLRALGELALYKPISGSFTEYAEEFIAPWAGFVTGWTYWFLWVVTGMAEITAIGLYVKYWFPDIPQWLPALLALIAVYVLNLIAVKVFGEVEFWLSIIKVVTIVALIVLGLTMIFTGWGNQGQPVGFSNLWDEGGFLPKGVAGIFLSLQMVMFAFLGTELVGVTAGEAKKPREMLPKAINSILWRILIFYIGALLVIMALFPWHQVSEKTSPFVLVFDKIGIAGAAGIVNFVVISAAFSSCNSGVFSTGRMLLTLSRSRQAPHAFGQINRRQLPAKAITASAIVLLFGVLLNYVIPEKAFAYITSVATVGALWTWGVIVYAHMQYKQAVKRGEAPEVDYRLGGTPVVNWLVIAFLVMVAVLLWFDPETRVALFVGPIWFLIIGIAYQFVKGRGTVTPPAET